MCVRIRSDGDATAGLRRRSLRNAGLALAEDPLALEALAAAWPSPPDRGALALLLDAGQGDCNEQELGHP